MKRALIPEKMPSGGLNMPYEDNACHFFRLPGELRNLVYAYTLTTCVAPYCKRDVHGAWHVYTEVEYEEQAKTSSKNNIRSDDSAMAESDLATNSSARHATLIVANELQFVSRALRSETRGLSSRFNDLRFDNLKEVMAWTSIFPPKEMRYLRKLHISSEVEDYYRRSTDAQGQNIMSNEATALQIYCLENPSITICNAICELRQDCPSFVVYAAMLRYHMKGRDDLFRECYKESGLLRGHLDRSLHYMPGHGEKLPEYHRLHLENQVFDEGKFRNSLTPGLISYIKRATEAEEGLDVWTVVARRVYEHGI